MLLKRIQVITRKTRNETVSIDHGLIPDFKGNNEEIFMNTKQWALWRKTSLPGKLDCLVVVTLIGHACPEKKSQKYSIRMKPITMFYLLSLMIILTACWLCLAKKVCTAKYACNISYGSLSALSAHLMCRSMLRRYQSASGISLAIQHS